MKQFSNILCEQKTNTGLRVNVVLVEKLYEKGLKASKMDLEKSD